MIIEKNRKIIEVGDKIHAQGMTFEIAKIAYQEYFEKDDFGKPDYFNIEFEDSNGGYHHWKSQFDGGYVIPKETPPKPTTIDDI